VLILHTIGVYGFSEEEFFAKVIEAQIDTFVDIRRRRGVRGHEYSFANCNYLQNKLQALNIKYVYCLDLAPTDKIRYQQYEIDKKTGTTKRKREELSSEFVESYTKEILKPFDIDKFMSNLAEAKNIVLFCVERNPRACHRSIVADYILKKYPKILVNHIQ